MKIKPEDPQANPIINAETVPVCAGANSCAITTFTGMVNSRISPPESSPAIEAHPDPKKNSSRSGTDPANDNMITMLDGLWDKSDRYRRLGLMLPSGADNRERDFVEHRKMMEMIIDRDAPGVADLMRQHIRLSLTVAAIDALDEQLGNTAPAKR